MPLIADSTGKIKGKFTVPANVPAGTKLVQFIGNQAKFFGVSLEAAKIRASILLGEIF